MLSLLLVVVLKQVLLNQVSDVINETSVSGDQLVTEFEILCENDDMIYVIEKKERNSKSKSQKIILPVYYYDKQTHNYITTTLID